MTHTDISKLVGMPKKMRLRLRDRLLVSTIEDFLLKTKEEESRVLLAKTLGLGMQQLDALREKAKEHLRSIPDIVHVGRLEGFFQTGGVIWCLYKERDDKRGVGGLQIIEEYDHLVVYAANGLRVFDGEICRGGASEGYPMRCGQPVALGVHVHWIQKGWEPDRWARLFFPEKGQPFLRATLTKRPPVID